MKEFIKKHNLIIFLTVAGAIGGFLYWKFIGCISGTCAIKSRWYLMTVYGAIVGYLVGSLAIDLKHWINRRKELKSRMNEK